MIKNDILSAFHLFFHWLSTYNIMNRDLNFRINQSVENTVDKKVKEEA